VVTDHIFAIVLPEMEVYSPMSALLVNNTRSRAEWHHAEEGFCHNSGGGGAGNPIELLPERMYVSRQTGADWGFSGLAPCLPPVV
jgi:hypothetical protein